MSTPRLNWLAQESLYERPRDRLTRDAPCITKEDAERMLLSAPRSIPPLIERRVQGTARPSVIAGFGVATLVFLAVPVYLLLGPVPLEQVDQVARIAPPLLAMLCIAVMALLLGTRQANQRLLHRGVVSQGRFESVIRTNTSMVEVRRSGRRSETIRTIGHLYEASLSHDVGKGPLTVRLRLWGRDGELAEQYMRQGVTITLLVDPLNPVRVLWLEVLRGMPVR